MRVTKADVDIPAYAAAARAFLASVDRACHELRPQVFEPVATPA